jgi:hypothetical protein
MCLEKKETSLDLSDMEEKETDEEKSTDNNQNDNEGDNNDNDNKVVDDDPIAVEIKQASDNEDDQKQASTTVAKRKSTNK